MTGVQLPLKSRHIVLMGVSGCGKTSIGKLLSKALHLPFTDGDDLHGQANRDKMAAGVPLTDEDRWPWLDLVGLTVEMPGGAIVACSALKRRYREHILRRAPDVLFVHLAGDRGELLERLENRKNHFMPPSLLDSQLEALEPLEDDEPGFTVRIGPDNDALVSQIVDLLKSTSLAGANANSNSE